MLSEKISIDQRAALAALIVLVVGGTLLRCLDPKQHIEQWLRRQPAAVAGGNASVGICNRPLPAPLLGMCVLMIAVALSVVACFIVYPDAHEVFEDMQVVRADALCAALSGDNKQAERQLHIWDDLARKLEIGTYLRQWRLTSAQRDSIQSLRRHLGELDDALDGRIQEKPKAVVALINTAYEKCRQAYQPIAL